MTEQQKQLVKDLDTLVGNIVQAIDARGVDVTGKLKKRTHNANSRPYTVEDADSNGMAFGYRHVKGIESNTITLNPLFVRGRRMVASA